MTELNQQSSLLGKIAAYTEIWAKDPSSTIFVSLGEAYRKMGMLDDAKDVVERGLVKNPEFSPAHIVLARILCQQGDYSGSETSFQRALESDSGSLAALVGYARLSILLGNEKRARKLLLEARDMSPADSIINKLLLSLPEELDVEPGRSSEVTEDLEDDSPVEQSKQLSLASITLAELYLKQGLDKEALEMYRQLSAQKPNDLMLRRQIRSLEERCVGSPTPLNTDLSATESIYDSSDVIIESQPPADDTDEGHPLTVDLTAADETSLHCSDPCCSDEGLSGKERVLETLHHWLDAIQQRRGNV